MRTAHAVDPSAITFEQTRTEFRRIQNGVEYLVRAHTVARTNGWTAVWRLYRIKPGPRACILKVRIPNGIIGMPPRRIIEEMLLLLEQGEGSTALTH